MRILYLDRKAVRRLRKNYPGIRFYSKECGDKILIMFKPERVPVPA